MKIHQNLSIIPQDIQFDDFLVHAPGLEPKSGGEEAFSLLRELSQHCLEDVYKGRTTTTKQLLTLLSNKNME